MKILIAADIFPPESGGPATYSVAIANAFKQDGVEVKIVTLNPDGEHVTSATYHVSRRNKILKYLNYFWLLFKHAKDVDVIYAMGPVNAGLPASWVAKLRRKKFVVKVVGDYAWEQGMQRFGTLQDINTFQNKKVRHSFPVYVLRWIQSFVVRHADRVIVPSEYLKKIVVGWGAQEKSVKVVYNAVEFKDVQPMKKPEGEMWLVSVGRLVPWKGMDTFIEIMPELLKEFPDLKLKIIGEGPVLKDLRSKIKDLRLENMVELTGNLPHDEALSYTAAADVFVLNSGYEGLSHVILEAINLRVSVLVSKMGGNPELVESENLFEYNNKDEIKQKISEILNKSRIASEIDLEKFSFKTMLEDTKKILEAV